MGEYPTLKKAYTLLSSDDNEIEGNSVELQKDCNEKVDEKISKDIVDYPLVINKDVDTNNITIKKRRFKITDHLTT